MVSWRCLLIPLITVYLPLQIFIILAIEVGKTQGGLTGDRFILLAIHQIKNPTLDLLATKLTGLGTYWGVLPLSVVIGLFLSYRVWWQPDAHSDCPEKKLLRRRSLLYWITTLLGIVFLSYSNKILWHRSRPHLWESFYPIPSNYAFPSGHAALTLTFVAALVILTWETPWRWWVLSFGSLFVLIISGTRLYLGVHYPSDILAGWILAIAWVIVVYWLLLKKS